MERRTGFAVAGAVAMILVAGAIAAGANLGLLGSARSSKVGTLKPADAAQVTTTASPQVVTVEVQDPAHQATAQVVPPSEAGSSPNVEVQTITVPPPNTSSSAHPVGEHEAETSSGAGADD